MDPTHYTSLDATAIARAVQAGEVSVGEVHVAATAQHHATHDDINAIVEWYDDPTPVSTTSGPLAGVPFIRKDYGSAEAGRLVEMGSRLAAGMRAAHTGEFIRRLQAAGALIVGRSAVPEFIQHGTTESVANGITRNPHNLEYSSGGSSGGSGAAVAAGVVPAGHASDCAGSIRIPAATCGLVGLKPSRRMVPWEGGGWGGIAEEFVVTRTARDASLFFDVLADGTTPANTGPLRIAFSNDHWGGAAIDPVIQAATAAFADRLASMGHAIVPVDPPVDQDELMSTWHALFSRWVAFDAHNAALATGRTIDSSTVEPTTMLSIEGADSLTTDDISRAQETQGQITLDLDQKLNGFDLLLTPALGRTAIPLGQLAATAGNLDAWIAAGEAIMPYNYLFNVTGWASASIPAGVGPEGLPLGILLSGRPGTERTILHLAHEVE